MLNTRLFHLINQANDIPAAVVDFVAKLSPPLETELGVPERPNPPAWADVAA